MLEYNNLQAMISKDDHARQYYNGLPAYIREQISSRGDDVRSFAALKSQAETLLEGL